MEFHACIMLKLPWILLLFSKALCFEDNRSFNYTEKNVTVICERDHEHNNMDVREVLGKWKAVNLYMHISKEGVIVYNSCPIITIWETDDFPRTTFGPSTENQLFHVQHMNAKFRQEYRHLRLLWDEAGQTTEYALYFRNDSAGYWQVFDGQNGTLTTRHNYQQFSGTVQVLKAVNDHLVLNFCQEPNNARAAQLYSVLFSRDPGVMARWEVDSVHAMLQNKKLSIASRRMVCGNSADKHYYSVTITIILFALTNVVSST